MHNTNLQWTTKEDQYLLDNERKYTRGHMANELGRTKEAIRQRYKHLNKRKIEAINRRASEAEVAMQNQKAANSDFNDLEDRVKTLTKLRSGDLYWASVQESERLVELIRNTVQELWDSRGMVKGAAEPDGRLIVVQKGKPKPDEHTEAHDGMGRVKPKLKVGQVWRNREGKEVTILRYSSNTTFFPYVASNGCDYTGGGKYYFNRESGIDLVELISDAPRNETTSPEVASIAAELLNLESSDIVRIANPSFTAGALNHRLTVGELAQKIRRVAASCLTQRG